MLYEALDILGERVIYYDTNSVIYIRIPGYRLFLLKMFETYYKDYGSVLQ